MSVDKCSDGVLCDARRKIQLFPFVLHERACGGLGSDTIAPFLVWEHPKTQSGKCVITFRFCPWCGSPWKPTGQINELDVTVEGSPPGAFPPLAEGSFDPPKDWNPDEDE